MAESPALTEAERKTWVSFYSLRRRLDRALDLQLQRDSGLSASEFEVLVALNRAPDRQLRVKEIASAIGWEKSRVSHLVTRMERRALIERSQCDTDARGSWVSLTAFGRRSVVGAVRGHTAAVRRYFLDVLEPGDAERLEALADRAIEAIGCAADEDAPPAAEIA